MRTHRNARTTWHSRLQMVLRVLDEGWSVTATAVAAGVSRTTVYRWLWRFEEEGEDGLFDRSSAPHRVWNRTGQAVVRRIERLRWRKLSARAIAWSLRMARSTVGGILRRLGLSRRRDLEPRKPVVRYEREVPGDLLHLDTKKLGRFSRPGKRVTGDRRTHNAGAGWEWMHVCIDDHSRVAYVEILEDETGEAAAGFVRRAVEWYAQLGVTTRQVLTDNGGCYRSHAYRRACAQLDVEPIRMRPRRPETNGKAERLIRTLLEEWAYWRPYRSSSARARALGPWLERYNRRRPHGGIGYVPPMTRIPGGL